MLGENIIAGMIDEARLKVGGVLDEAIEGMPSEQQVRLLVGVGSTLAVMVAASHYKTPLFGEAERLLTRLLTHFG